MDQKNQRLLRGSEDILKAQEASVSEQNSILATLDRLFFLYDSILYESRALKMFIFYATSWVFIYVFTSPKQTNSARPILYSGLCISMAIELYLIKTCGALLINQQWLHISCYWIRAVFAAFTILIIALVILTYREVNWRNNQPCFEIYQRLSKPTIQSEKKNINGHQFSFEDIKSCDNGLWPKMPSFRLLSLRLSSQKQAIASKIIRGLYKFMKKRRGNRRLLHKRSGADSNDDALRAWMTSRGMDITSLDHSDTDSDDSGDDPDFECMSYYPALPNRLVASDRYLLRSQCNKRCRRSRSWRTNL